MNNKHVSISTLLALPLILSGCGGGINSAVDTNDSGNGSDNSGSDVWIVNSTDEVSQNLFESGSSQGSLVNVQSVNTETLADIEYTVVAATGVANYQVTLTQAQIDELNNRPKAATDFLSGVTTAQADVAFEFGEDIGYNSSSTCVATGGDGYWPPGPVCPENLSRVGYFPNTPEPASEDVASGLGAMGYWVNGTSIYQWGDGQSYNSQGVWFTLAPVAEIYDVDVCGGHAANGDYHHHFSSDCLANMVNDEGTEHSPIYGYAGDGYPIYGPWYSEGVLVKSSWTLRDYSADSITGCSEEGVRSCVLVDEFNVALGTQTAVTSGPTITDTYTSLSGNNFIASTGFFYEDFYWDSALTALGGEYLDENNGHDNGDEKGYHYHVTVTLSDDGKKIPAFPYTIGPRFYGKLQDSSVALIEGNAGQTQMGGGNMGPGPGGEQPDLPICEEDQEPMMGVCLPAQM